ncbi:MAG: hypothetical protein IPL39_17980 [Opitutaceae bacterium]|nr:hypothetical protein [Opitutaceae bacterium]
MSNGPFGALAEGIQAGFGMRQAYKARKFDEEEQTRRGQLDEEMKRATMEANLRKLALDEQMAKWSQGHGDAQLGMQREQFGAQRADATARQDAAFAGASPQAQQMMLAGNRPAGVGVYAPGAGPADVQRFQERMPLVQERLGQEQEDRARGIQMQEQAQRDTQSRLAAQMLTRFGAGNGRNPAMGYQEITSKPDEDGSITRTRMPIMPGQMPAAPAPKAPENPELEAVNAAITAQQRRIGEERIKRANGEGRGWFGLGDGPDQRIAAAQKKIGALQTEAAMGQPSAALPLGAAPAAQAPAVSPQDQQMRAWAQANPNNPRAQMILQKLGQR